MNSITILDCPRAGVTCGARHHRRSILPYLLPFHYHGDARPALFPSEGENPVGFHGQLIKIIHPGDRA
jgi:hypothetical protein